MSFAFRASRLSCSAAARAPWGTVVAAGALSLLSGAARLTAQEAHADGELRWQLPERGAARFTREERLETEVLETSERPPPGRNPDLHLFDWRQRNPPILFESELDADRQVAAEPSRDLRDVASHVAFDLRRAAHGGRLRYVFPRLFPFGDVHLTGIAAPPVAGGEATPQQLRQTLELTLRREPPDPAGERRDTFARWIAAECRVGLEGTLRIERHVDPSAGSVRAFDAVLEATVTWPEGEARRRARLVLRQNWRLTDVREPRDAEFRAAVAGAIERGTKWLRNRLREPTAGDFADRPATDGRTFHSGRLALALLALQHAGGGTNDDPIVRAGLDELRRREITDTYSLALALMALERSLAPRGERERLIADARARPEPRRPDEADRQRMREWVDRLLANCDANVPTGQVRRWNYVPGAGFDNSNTQYALLGLWSAHLCGIEVPDKVWLGAAHHWLKEQQAVKGDGLDLQLTSYHDLERVERGEPLTVARRRVQPAGFGYDGGGGPPYGSMTAAGVASLALCRYVLAERRASTALLSRIDGAIRDGFGWLATNFSLRCNPGFAPQWHNRRYYWMYGLERACEFSRVALLQERDWYFEGAMLLLAWQAESGEFTGDVHTQTTGIDNTAFALLFLKKAALPVTTGGR